jgi:very-short-patch-repair endonuclease
VLPLADGAAASPKESWLRLLLIDAGQRRLATQMPVNDGWRSVGVLDMGWEDYMVAVEYDGDQHRTDRRQFVKDIDRLAEFQDLGWTVIRVVAEHRRDDTIGRAHQALIGRGYSRDRR